MALLAYVLIRDTPAVLRVTDDREMAERLPEKLQREMGRGPSPRERFSFKYVLNNKMLWFIAIANAFVYMVRYGCLDWAPTYLKEAQGYDIKEAGWAYFAYEFAAIPGTLVCGWLSDVVFKGTPRYHDDHIHGPGGLVYLPLLALSDNYMIVTLSLIAIGFFIYGPVMLIGGCRRLTWLPRTRRDIGRVDRVLSGTSSDGYPGERGDGIRGGKFIRVGRDVRAVARRLRLVHRFRRLYLQGRNNTWCKIENNDALLR